MLLCIPQLDHLLFPKFVICARLRYVAINVHIVASQCVGDVKQVICALGVRKNPSTEQIQEPIASWMKRKAK
eukprot:2428813-Karenia_brevis.AAC.1